ncbi:MAG: hypothetical protein NT015_05355 [Alphaproteobacteria bacterium]|nr:hypothetical protein [Alphaproteobacteria bacterium]
MKHNILSLAAALVAGVVLSTMQSQAQTERESMTAFMREYERLALVELRRITPDAKLRTFYLGELDSSASCDAFLRDLEGAYEQDHRLARSVDASAEQAQSNMDAAAAAGIQFEYAAFVGAYVEFCDDNTIVAITCGCREANSSCLAYGALMQMDAISCQSPATRTFNRLADSELSVAADVYARHHNNNTIDLRNH